MYVMFFRNVRVTKTAGVVFRDQRTPNLDRLCDCGEARLCLTKTINEKVVCVVAFLWLELPSVGLVENWR